MSFWPPTPRPLSPPPPRGVLLLIAAVCALAPGSDAIAGGMEIGDTGAEALGRGGAFVAKADNPAAVNYNPAGFVKLRGHHVTISTNVLRSDYSFTRAGGGLSSSPYPTMSNLEPWAFAPLHLMVTSDLGIFRRLTFAAGYYAPAGTPRRSYPDTVISDDGFRGGAPQRYDMIPLSGVLFFPTLGAAYRITDWLDLGLTLQTAVYKAELSTYATVGAACNRAEDPDCDIRADLNVKDIFSPTGSIGLLARPLPHWEFGTLLRLPSSATLTGKAKLTLAPNVQRIADAMTTPMVEDLNPRASMNAHYPLMLRLGGRYVFYRGNEEAGDIEANVTFENWSSASQRTVTLDTFSLGKPLAPTRVDWKLKDTFGFRIGGAYRFALHPQFDLVLRSGIFGETATTDVSDTTLNLPGPKRLGLTAGLGLRYQRFALDLAFAHVFFPTRVVTQSTISAREFSHPDSTGPVVGNGTYQASTTIISLQFTASFGEGSRPSVRFARQPHALGPQFAQAPPPPLSQPPETQRLALQTARAAQAAPDHARKPIAVFAPDDIVLDGVNSPAVPAAELLTFAPTAIRLGAPRASRRCLRRNTQGTCVAFRRSR